MYAINQDLPRSCEQCPFLEKRDLFKTGALEIKTRYCTALDEFIPVTNSDLSPHKSLTKRPKFCPLMPISESAVKDDEEYVISNEYDDEETLSSEDYAEEYDINTDDEEILFGEG